MRHDLHASCRLHRQPIVTDMVAIQRITGGKLAMVGGIDGPKIDIENIIEEQIRQEVRRAIDTYCPAGRFYPSIPN